LLLWLVVHAGINVQDVYGTARSFLGGLIGG
jgi:hypothetical protein